MFTFADESGNTGTNLLDRDQPIYYAGAIMAKVNLDEKYKGRFERFAASQGHTHLHAGEMGMGKLIEFLPVLERFVQKDMLRFFLGRIEKRWFIVVKFFDLMFDPHDNRGVSAHHYWVGPLRFYLLDKLHLILRDEDLGEIWPALLARDFHTARGTIIQVATRLLPRLDELKDRRVAEIFREAFTWATKHPEELGVDIQKKHLVLAHYPNVAMITPLLGAVQKQAELWGTRPKVITHDQSSQFQSAWKQMHQDLSKAESVEFALIGGPTQRIGVDKNSIFVIGDSKKSAGIQFIDVILWLWKRKQSGDDLPYEAARLLNLVLRVAQPYDMSHASTLRMRNEMLAPILNSEASPDDLEKGHALLREFEAKRQARMQELENSQ